MPYDKISDLPSSVRHNLPKDAQEIYMTAFNNGWKDYDDPKEKQEKSSREETAHQVAWDAVKRDYIKKDGKWQRK